MDLGRPDYPSQRIGVCQRVIDFWQTGQDVLWHIGHIYLIVQSSLPDTCTGERKNFLFNLI